jgi:hypothetical protein
MSLRWVIGGRVESVMCSDSEAGSYLRLIDSCITQLEAQGPARTCNESEEEEEEKSCAALTHAHLSCPPHLHPNLKPDTRKLAT